MLMINKIDNSVAWRTGARQLILRRFQLRELFFSAADIGFARTAKGEKFLLSM